MPWSYDEYGFPVYYDDPSQDYFSDFRPEDYTYGTTGTYDTSPVGEIPYYLQLPEAQEIDWMNLDWTNPQLQAAFGLTAEDFYDPTAASPGAAPVGAEEYPTTISNEGLMTLVEGGVTDFSGLDLTDEQIVAIRDNGLTADTAVQDAPGFWQRALGTLGSAGSAVGGAVMDAAAKNPIAALTALAGGGAALAALLRPGPEAVQLPDFTAPQQMSPEQRALYSQIQQRAAQEAQLGDVSAPAQAEILRTIHQQTTGQYLPESELSGLARQARTEQEARNLALQNIMTDLGAPPDPMAYPEEYQQWLANAHRAEQLVGAALEAPALPGAYAEQEAAKLRQQFQRRMLEAYGPGYTTSLPSVEEEYTRFEPAIRDRLEKEALARKAQELAMYTGVSAPRFQQAEQARQASYGRRLAGRAADIGTYQGLNETARTLGQLAETARTASPYGAAERGLGALTGQQGMQQQLISSLQQFNAQQEAAKNAELWKFAGTALGGGLYSLGKTA